MKRAVTLTLLLLAGCGSLPKAGPQAALYDFGIDSSTVLSTTSQLRLANVEAAAGLAGSDMRYRLAYQNPARVFFYAESRWIAPPAKLLARHFEQRTMQNNATQCALYITVETFDQIFDTPDISRGVVRLHASIIEGSGRQANAHTLLASAERTAATADARGGVAALIGAADDAFTRIVDWTDGLPCGKNTQPRP
jgi:ABC-type uncharacterized transport system auxiliary subunit